MKIYLTRRYRFSASHRLHNRALSSEENTALYGKCNNPYGHGHNYAVEVTVAGPVDPRTGMVLDLVELDRWVGEAVVDRFDHTHLNQDVEHFRSQIPTTENLCQEIYRLLKIRMDQDCPPREVTLARIRMEETHANSFEFTE